VIDGWAILPDLFFGADLPDVDPCWPPQNGINGTTKVRRTITATNTAVNERSIEKDTNRAASAPADRADHGLGDAMGRRAW
jgi:hypothetical protein